MRIQIILDQPNFLGRRRIGRDELVHEMGVITSRPLGGHVEKAPAASRLKREQHTTGALTNICIILASWTSRSHRHGGEDIAKELTGPFVKAQNRPFRDIGFLI